MKRRVVIGLIAIASFNTVLALVGLHLAGERDRLLQERGRLEARLAHALRETARLQAAAHLSAPDADESLIPEEYSIAVVHALPVGCGEVAFYRKPGPTGVSALTRLPNGTKPATNSPIVCGHCGRAAWPLYERARVLPPR